jgi:hypothetical protein
MSEKLIQFQVEKETKNTVKFKEVPEPGQPPVIDTLYVQKWALPANCKAVTVVLKAE